jgi:anti-sigma B factor antagonist
MQMTVEHLEGGVARIVLRGRFDTTGAVQIELPFNTAATGNRKLIADLTGVDFLASYGVRVLLMGAKVVEAKGGRLVIVCAENNVAKVLDVAGTRSVIPVFGDTTAALAALAQA